MQVHSLRKVAPQVALPRLRSPTLLQLAALPSWMEMGPSATRAPMAQMLEDLISNHATWMRKMHDPRQQRVQLPAIMVLALVRVPAQRKDGRLITVSEVQTLLQCSMMQLAKQWCTACVYCRRSVSSCPYAISIQYQLSKIANINVKIPLLFFEPSAEHA